MQLPIIPIDNAHINPIFDLHYLLFVKHITIDCFLVYYIIKLIFVPL